MKPGTIHTVTLVLLVMLAVYTMVVTVGLANRINDLDGRLDRIEQEP